MATSFSVPLRSEVSYNTASMHRRHWNGSTELSNLSPSNERARGRPLLGAPLTLLRGQAFFPSWQFSVPLPPAQLVEPDPPSGAGCPATAMSLTWRRRGSPDCSLQRFSSTWFEFGALEDLLKSENNGLLGQIAAVELGVLCRRNEIACLNPAQHLDVSVTCSTRRLGSVNPTVTETARVHLVGRKASEFLRGTH